MYSVMIVDDEMLVRLGLKSMVNWEELGFKIVSEAGNGQAAYEKFLVTKPDIVITDIKMPKKDGLWLTERIKEDYPETEIIILTCYDEFDYARQALKLQVSDYILKAEMEEEDIKAIMLEKKAILDKRSRPRVPVKKLHDSQGDNLLGMLLNLKYPLEKVYGLMDTMQLEYRDKNNCFAIFDFSAGLGSEKYAQEQAANVIAVCMELIENKMEELQESCFLKQLGKSIIVFVISEELSDMKMRKTIEYIGASVNQYFSVALKTAVTPVLESIEKSRGYVEWLYDAANYMFYIHPGENLTTGNYDGKRHRHFSPDKELFRKISSSILSGDMEKAHEEIEALFGQMQEGQKTIFDFKLYMARLVNDMSEELTIYVDASEEPDGFQQRIMQKEDCGQILELMEEYLDFAESRIVQSKVDNSDILIRKAQTYMEEHYQEKISLDEIAGVIGISRYYFSTLFKQAAGTNFSTYLNEIRIKKAKELLKNSNITVGQIYDRVGFNDQQYFCKTFKKYTGLTVTEYREQF